MSNFTFLSATLPGAYADCARAESYVTSDPRAACVYARRAVELLVNHLYAPSAKRWTLRCPTRHQEPTPFACTRIGVAAVRRCARPGLLGRPADPKISHAQPP